MISGSFLNLSVLGLQVRHERSTSEIAWTRTPPRVGVPSCPPAPSDAPSRSRPLTTMERARRHRVSPSRSHPATSTGAAISMAGDRAAVGQAVMVRRGSGGEDRFRGTGASSPVPLGLPPQRSPQRRRSTSSSWASGVTGAVSVLSRKRPSDGCLEYTDKHVGEVAEERRLVERERSAELDEAGPIGHGGSHQHDHCHHPLSPDGQCQ